MGSGSHRNELLLRGFGGEVGKGRAGSVLCASSERGVHPREKPPSSRKWELIVWFYLFGYRFSADLSPASRLLYG